MFVAVADREFENWLIADPQGIFQNNLVKNDPTGRVGNRADGKDAIAILKWAFGRNSYSKTIHGPLLAGLVDVSDSSVLARSPSLAALVQLRTP